MILCHLITCYSIESAWFQRLKLKCDEPLSNFAFNFNLRRYNLDIYDFMLTADQAAAIEAAVLGG